MVTGYTHPLKSNLPPTFRNSMSARKEGFPDLPLIHVESRLETNPGFQEHAPSIISTPLNTLRVRCGR